MCFVINIYRSQPRNYYKIICRIGDVIHIFDEVTFPLAFPYTFEALLTEYGGTTAGITLARILNRLGV